MSRQEFIKQIAPYIVKECQNRGYKFPSAIIAQAILESNSGMSSLASKYHNYFGIKCGSAWKGKSVNLTTSEEYTAGTYTTIKDNFRVYDDMESGVKGYFDFIGYSRYNNLKTAVSSKNYLELIKQDGYATSSKYVDNVYKVVTTYNLTIYDSMQVVETNNTLSQAITIIAKEVIKGTFGNGHENRKNNIYELVRAELNRQLRG